MNLKTITDNVLKLSSSFTREQGKTLAKVGSVNELKNKNIDGTYHIYGRVLNDNKSKAYGTHIKIDTRTDRVLDTKCTCETFEENRREIRNYVCKHIVATSWTFYSVARKKLQAQKATSVNENIKKDTKRYLNLDLIIKCIKYDGIPSYLCEFRIGINSTHLIMDLRDFINKDNDKRPVVFNHTFTYNPIKDEFLELDKKYLIF